MHRGTWQYKVAWSRFCKTNGTNSRYHLEIQRLQIYGYPLATGRDFFGTSLALQIKNLLKRYCFYAVDRPKSLVIGGKTVTQLIDEIDKLFIDKNNARHSTTKSIDGKSVVEHKLPTYDYRASDYTYKSISILGKLHDQYCRNLKLWTQLNSDRDEISNGGHGGQLDIHLMTYKAKYFATNEARYKTERNLRVKLSNMYDEYIRQVNAIPKNSLRFKDFWFELIKSHYRDFKRAFPDENDRRIASVILYEQIRGRDYSRNPIESTMLANMRGMCIDELCSIKAHMIDDGRQFVISKHRAPVHETFSEEAI